MKSCTGMLTCFETGDRQFRLRGTHQALCLTVPFYRFNHIKPIIQPRNKFQVILCFHRYSRKQVKHLNCHTVSVESSDLLQGMTLPFTQSEMCVKNTTKDTCQWKYLESYVVITVYLSLAFPETTLLFLPRTAHIRHEFRWSKSQRLHNPG